MTTIRFSGFEQVPVGLLDTSSITTLAIDNGQPGRADPVQPIERSCQFLAARRKVAAAGLSRNFSRAGDDTWNFRIPRDGYSERLRVRIRCNLTGASSDDDFVTVKVVSDTDATGLSERVHNDPNTPVTVDDAVRVTLVLDYGDGTSGSLGFDNVAVSFTRSNNGTVHVYSITFQPVDMQEIEVP